MQQSQSIDTRFWVPRTPVEILDVGDAAEASLVRGLLESLGAVVTLHRPGTPGDFKLVLGQGATCAPYLIVCAHGDEHGIVLGDYSPAIDTSGLVRGGMAAGEVHKHVRLPGCVVVSTACGTGAPEWGEAFLEGGASAYVAPDGEPEGADVPLFVHLLFHRLLVHKAGIEAAWRHASSYDLAGSVFVLHRDGVVHRNAVG